ncbi:microtubule-associated protein futsch [Drosophila takahashii]|uniref:microtubule-associated protein futsch n=1 Tax=Drosophila takahashii TaxID=29030 RepID=UPI001CF89FA2|nr:serine/arginine repetitive matrix protein 2 [Drosophila takahashii]
MGCASSTPMVATAGSEMLKAASHVKQKGEAVVEEASGTLTTTLDTAKETVGTAVAGITNELGNAFKEGTQALDEAKHKVMEGLHLEEPQESDAKTDQGEATMSTSRAPTPQLKEDDADSLKTSTPEPEIERALANEEESPPSPKPTLEEMVELSAEVSQVADAPAPAPPATESAPPAAEAPASGSTAPVESRKVRRRGKDKRDKEQQRPSTTEWEKFADQLAKSKKFKPYESFAHSQNKFSVYQDHTSLRDKPNHYDGHFSGGNSQSASQSDLSSGHITPAPTRRGQREFAKFVGSEQPGSISRSSSRLSNAASRTFDFNPQRERISLPVATRIGSGIQRAPAERISGWGRGRPTPLAEEPGYAGRRMSTGVIPQSLRPEREKFLGTGSRRAVQPITPTKDSRREKSSKKSSSRESSYLELDSRRADKSPLRISKPLSKQIVRSREPSFNEFDSMKAHKSPLRGSKEIRPPINTASREPSYRELKSLKTNKIPMGLQKPSTKEVFRSREPSYIEFDSFKKDESPLRNESLAKEIILSREQSHIEFDSYKADKSPVITNEKHDLAENVTKKHHTSSEHLPQRDISPSEVTRTPTNQNLSSAPQTPQNTEDPAVTTSKMPSPPASRVSSGKSSDSSNLDVIIQPLSSLNTPSVKSFTQSPDQVVMEGYEDSDLEAALARLEILRGSTATLHSLRSCSPGKHTYTASLLSSRRTSPWVMRKKYGGTIGREMKPSPLIGSSLKSSETSHQTLERCDICYNEFIIN